MNRRALDCDLNMLRLLINPDRNHCGARHNDRDACRVGTDTVPERETPRAIEANTPHRLTKQFVALTPMELGQEIFLVTRRRLFVAFQPKQLCDFVIHFTAKYWFVRQIWSSHG